ncbi:hypothetical protein RJ639_013837 [Escallonia herrerae]|uniref:Uncharacterized protein n=1 Tax=Escallonia herrerae TaxID=1293975 RepID=A0AA89ANM9_9ASTE|nr:hypothetical protein RJ639_013837 [Escallonia herrerae]
MGLPPHHSNHLAAVAFLLPSTMSLPLPLPPTPTTPPLAQIEVHSIGQGRGTNLSSHDKGAATRRLPKSQKQSHDHEGEGEEGEWREEGWGTGVVGERGRSGGAHRCRNQCSDQTGSPIDARSRVTPSAKRIFLALAKSNPIHSKTKNLGPSDLPIYSIRGTGFTIQIAYVLTIPKPIMDEAADEVIKQIAMKQKWEEDDTYCKGYILGGMSYTLYDVYEIKYANNTANELWDDLDNKYKTEEVGNKKFLISKLFDFRMVDSKSVITQIHELQIIMNLIISKGHSLDESFQVSTIISKLPLAWKECYKELKQMKNAMTMQELVKYIQVEENSRDLDRLELEDNKSSKDLIVDHGFSSGTKCKLDG